MRSGGVAKCQLFSQVANSVDETDNSNLLPRSHSASLGRERSGYGLTLKIGEMKLGACYALILFPLFVSACSLLVTKKISVRSQEH